MTKFEKVIKGLECCGSLMDCARCPYDGEDNGCFTILKGDALKLLKRAGCFLEEGLHYFPCGKKLLEDETHCEGDVG